MSGFWLVVLMVGLVLFIFGFLGLGIWAAEKWPHQFMRYPPPRRVRKRR